MIKHYLKNAIKSFSRNKFVTFINVFGISFTLLVVTILFSFFNLKWGTDTPNENKYKIVTIRSMEMIAYQYDTIYHLDSSMVDGGWVYDTLDFELNKRRGVSNSTSSLSYLTIKNYLSNLKNSEDMSFIASDISNVFLPSGKLSVGISFTDSRFWNLYPYELVDGRFFNESDVKNKESVLVITEKLANKYFGKTDVVNQILTMNQKEWTVIGVVKNPREYESDCFIPFTHIPDYQLNDPEPLGDFTVVIMTKDNQQITRLKSELKSIASTISPYENYTEFFFYPVTFEEKFATDLMGLNSKDGEKAFKKMKFRFMLFGLFFVLLPILNLLNVNLSRILERKSEIGIRKAFGANSTDVFYQFLFENVLLSVVAGLLAIVASYACIRLINSSEILDDTLALNWLVIFYGILAAFVFGFLFGVLPAIKLSKLNIVTALKN